MSTDDKPWAAWSAAAFLASRRPKGWWRRNAWGLLAIVPLLAAVVWLRWDDIYWAWWKTQPHVPVQAAPQQWVSFAGAQLRLIEFGEAEGLTQAGGEPLELPSGLRAWTAVIEFKVPKQELVYGCRIMLEDAQARTFGMSPTELSRARLPFETCTDPSGKDSTDYRSTVYFVMPRDAEPAAVRIVQATQYPDFARLRIGG